MPLLKITPHVRTTSLMRSADYGTRGLRTFLSGMVFCTLLLCGQLQAAGAGLLAGGAQKLEPLTLSVVEPLAKGPYELESGGYYKIDIICDGSGELALGGADFFRNIWINEIVINDIEIRPLGISSLEFDDEGTATISFIAIRPGSYEIKIPGTKGESQRAIFNII